jgi:hypothetical protein
VNVFCVFVRYTAYGWEVMTINGHDLEVTDNTHDIHSFSLCLTGSLNLCHLVELLGSVSHPILWTLILLSRID